MLLHFIIYISLILVFSGIDISSGPVCKHHRYNRYEYFCCENYERKQGKCIECEKGYLSMGFGEPCKQCKRNLYGFRCAEYCHCKYNQRCDHVIGCVNVSSTHSNETTIFFTENTSILHLIRTTAHFTNNTGTQVNDKLVYATCAGSFIVIIVMTISIFICYRKRYKKNVTKHERHMNAVNQVETNFEKQCETFLW